MEIGNEQTQMKKKEDHSSVSLMSEEKNDKPTVTKQNKAGLPVQAQPESNTSSRVKADRKEYLKGLIFFALMWLNLVFLSYFYYLLHGVNFFQVLAQRKTISSFDFVGENANVFSVGVEIVYWTLFGVICQMAYRSGREIIDGEFDFWKSMFYWIGINMYALGIAIAVIFSLEIISLSIGGIDITLANAPIEVIITIAFILGFYSEEARQLLGKLRGKIVSGIDD